MPAAGMTDTQPDTHPDPAAPQTRAGELAHLWWTLLHTLSDSQQVITMRLLGLGGVWPVPQGETVEMVREKAPVFTEALISGALTALRGQSPDRVLLATIDPISNRARQNRARLAGVGPSDLTT